MLAEVKTVPFSKLVASDEINARPKTREGLDTLTASIERQGLIVPLAVRAGDSGKFEIIDGRRRHAAIAQLVKSKVLEKDYEVPVLVRDDDDASALETSFVANSERLPPHPVDQHDVFVRLAETHGLSNADLEARFGIKERTVRQQLALGKLAKPIRDAYRKGTIDAKTAQAFTRVEDPDCQVDVFERLRKKGKHYLNDHAVRSELSDDRESVKDCALMKFVGEEAYLKAGGKISEDLFDEERLVDDMPLLKKLARAKLEIEVKRVKADGWKWAEARLDDDEGEFNEWQCENVKGEDADNGDAEDFSAAERKKSGVLVCVDYEGKLECFYGLIKPSAKKPAKSNGDAHDDDGEFGDEEHEEPDDAGEFGDVEGSAKSPNAGPAGPYDVSQALMQRLSTQLTVAASKTLAQDPSLALRVVAAALLASRDSPADIANRGHVAVRGEADFSSRFGNEFARLQSMPAGDALDRAFARAAATTLNLLSWNPTSGGVNDPRARALIPNLSAQDFLEEMRQAFDASDYFNSAKKDAAIEAIEEMRAAIPGLVLASRQQHSALKKAELTELAIRMAKSHGWLPPDLRHPEYELIGAKSAATGKKRRSA